MEDQSSEEKEENDGRDYHNNLNDVEAHNLDNMIEAWLSTGPLSVVTLHSLLFLKHNLKKNCGDNSTNTSFSHVKHFCPHT